VRLAEINGGGMRNAIPREGHVVVLVPEENASQLIQNVTHYESIFKAELNAVEPNLSFVIEKTDAPLSMIEERVQDDLIDSVYACPNGVIRMSDGMPGMVETSTNLSTIKSEKGVIFVKCLLRSSVESAKDDLVEQVDSVFALGGAMVSFDGGYPGWKPNMDSEILKQMKEIYHTKFGKIPAVMGIHAGLECGILGANYPNWDMISFGPTMRSPHSPDERVNIASVKKFWEFLVEVLKNAPVK
jgi:dipeptidase D